MPREFPPLPSSRRPVRSETWAIAAWSILVVVVLAQSLVAPRSHTVYPIFDFAGQNWRQGLDLYRDYRKSHHLEFYRYSPAATPVFAAFSLVPLTVGGFAWRVLNSAALLAGLAWFYRSVLPQSLRARDRGLFFLLTLPLCAMSMHNGQPNALAIGLILLAAAATAERKFNLAAAMIIIAATLKIYPLAIGMLIAIKHPKRMIPPLVVGALLAFGFPYLTQSPEYVSREYRNWLTYLGKDARLHVTLPYAYRDLRFIGLVWGWKMGERTYQVVQLAAAAATAAMCGLAIVRRWPEKSYLRLACGLATVWMTLFGPATESCTFIYIAPSLAWSLLDVWKRPLGLRDRFAPTVALGLFLLDIVLPGGSALPYFAVQTWGAVFLAIALIQSLGSSRSWKEDDALGERSTSTSMTGAAPRALDPGRRGRPFVTEPA